MVLVCNVLRSDLYSVYLEGPILSHDLVYVPLIRETELVE